MFSSSWRKNQLHAGEANPWRQVNCHCFSRLQGMRKGKKLSLIFSEGEGFELLLSRILGYNYYSISILLTIKICTSILLNVHCCCRQSSMECVCLDCLLISLFWGFLWTCLWKVFWRISTDELREHTTPLIPSPLPMKWDIFDIYCCSSILRDNFA